MPPETTGPSAPVPATKANGSYTWQEVAKHNTEDSAWIIIRNGGADDGASVYDITEWLDKHPGGKEVLLLAAGRDCTDLMSSYHPFTTKPAKYLKSFKIGTLTGPLEFPGYAPDTGFYRTLCERVDAYFKENGLDTKPIWPGLWRMALVFATAFFTFAVMHDAVWSSSSFAVRVVAAVVFGVCQALPLLHVMHDASHTAIGHNELWWKAAGRFCLDFFAGASMVSWHHQHVVGHHVYTNVVEVDPDMPSVLTGDPRRLVRQQRWASVYKWQHLYLPPLYGILGMRSRVNDITATWAAQSSGNIRVNWYSSPFTRLVVTKAVWAAWRIALPLLLWQPRNYWGLFFIAEFVTGYFLAFNFQVSHISTAADFPNDKATPAIYKEWAVQQVLSSVDYGHTGPFAWFTAFFSGALNYQIIHHLLPCVSQYHYPAITPILRQTCREFGIRYPYVDTFTEAFKLHLQHLKQLGAEGKAAHFD